MSQTPSSKEGSSTEEVSSNKEVSSLKEESRPGATGTLVWDLPLRLFHWAFALSLVGSWATAEAGFDWTETHFLFGYTALGLSALDCSGVYLVPLTHVSIIF